MHTISIFVDQNRMPKLAYYFECQTHLAKKTAKFSKLYHS